MRSTLIVRPLAEDDLLKASRWYERQSRGLGRRFLLECERVFDHICENPLQFAEVHGEVRAAIARRFPYVVYYRIRSDCVIVSAVIHAKRSERRWKSRFK
jgi:plasmid stabilization system protein ParE